MFASIETCKEKENPEHCSGKHLSLLLAYLLQFDFTNYLLIIPLVVGVQLFNQSINQLIFINSN